MPSVLLSRRWKKVAVEPPRPLPKFDLLQSIQTTKSDAISVHNPLVEVEIKKKEEAERIKRIEAEEFEKYVPAVRGLYPQAPLDDLKLIWAQFIADHNGIKKTFTRRFFGIHEWDGPINLKRCFGDVNVFNVFRPQEYRHGRVPFIYRNEFNFEKPAYTGEQLLNILDLYVNALYMAPAEGRKPIMGYFYIIIKAIRMRPKIHQKLLSSVRFKDLVMSYFLIANQPHLALYVAIDQAPRCQSGALNRWVMARLLNLSVIYDGNKEAIVRLKNLEGGTKELGYKYEREYKLNLLTQNIFEYYCSRKSMNVTDAELIWLIRCAESRMLLRELMDLLPLVIKRLVGKPDTLSSVDKVELAYEPYILDSEVKYETIVARYALAFVRLGNNDMARKFLLTFVEMPNRSLTIYPGCVSGLTVWLVEMMQESPDDSSILFKTLEHFGNSKYDRLCENFGRIGFLDQLSSDIVKYMLAGQSNISIRLSLLLHRLGATMSFNQSFSIFKRIYDKNHTLGLQWYGFVFRLINEINDNMKKWLVQQLRKDRQTFMDHFVAAMKDAPINMSRLAQALCGVMYDYEADRRYLLARAFVGVNETKNGTALGIIIGSASTVPRKLVRPVSGPYSVLQRGHTVAQLIRNIDIDGNAFKLMINGLAKACLNLNAVESSNLLWREVLRHGIDPNNGSIKKLILLRLNAHLDMADTLEAVKYILSITKLPWSPARIENMQADMIAQGILEDSKDSMIVEQYNALSDLPMFRIKTSQFFASDVRAYISIMDALSRAGLHALVEPMAIYILASSDLLRLRSLGVVSAVWLDAIGFNPNATSVDIQEAWYTLKMYSRELARRYKEIEIRVPMHLNMNTHHSAIEAYIRKCDFEMAWHMVHVEMRAHNLFPNVSTFCTLLSPLAVSENLWPLGKQMVIKCNTYYPGVIKSLLESPDVSHITKVLITSALQQ
ncbi:hypothetical protein J3B02_003657 [Coemansia erecta]|nr:hypothetical protein J3B02_003657 [Coemansia erecta]